MAEPALQPPRWCAAEEATAWVPGSKPIWFTEFGCAALDKATNQPNKFLDAMSSESMLPHFSDGTRNDAIQAAYVEATMAHWRDRPTTRSMPMACGCWTWTARMSGVGTRGPIRPFRGVVICGRTVLRGIADTG
ncbi:glycoside hydrolase TIM-barrel-like domain-containing protein [Paracoccus marcusii]|nr:glycoside hydrolase TIM-barrel-like domain-containing protein [Paracoccus marcusii]